MDFSLVQKFGNDYYPMMWTLIFLYIVVIFYIIPTFGYKKDNVPKYYKHLFAMWNLMLSLYSIACAVIMGLYVFNFTSLQKFICMCDNNNIMTYDPFFTRSVDLISSSFVISKYIEFGDTVFLAIMHKKILFLHWYHHILTAYCTTVLIFQKEPIGLLFLLMNAIVHSIMYFYFFVSQYSNKLNFIKKSITILQTVQMFGGLILIAITYYYTFMRKSECNDNYPLWSLTRVFLMYLSYFVLFVKLYCDLYLK
jgi:hypothetical protein